MARPPHVSEWLSFTAVCLGVACGTDKAGTSPVHVDAGGLAVLDDAGAGGTTPASAGGTGGAGGDSSPSGNSSGSSPVEAGNASGGGDASSVATGEGGEAASSTGADAGDDSARGEAGTSDSGALCGPNGTSSCGQNQLCDPTLGCVTCLMDSQCPASTRWCLQGSCVQCRTSADCGGGTTPACFPADHSCHAPCTSNQQCQDNSANICNVSTGVCVGCNTSHDCPTSQGVCDPITQQCVQCASNADCAGTSTPACLRNRCVVCASNADCSGATPYCSAGGDNGPRCVQCLQSSQCPPSAPSCNSGTCGMSSG